MKTEQTEVNATEQTALPIEGLIDAKSITAYLAISPAMLSKLRKAGAIKPPVKIGNMLNSYINQELQVLKDKRPFLAKAEPLPLP